MNFNYFVDETEQNPIGKTKKAILLDFTYR